MASKIAPFTLTDPDMCVKCGKDMPEGTEATWLREPDRKGYYHPACANLPTQEGLTKVKVQAQDSPLGYVWMRVNAIPTRSLLGETTPATRLVPTEAKETNGEANLQTRQARPVQVVQDTVLPRVPEGNERPQLNADGILLNALATALLPKLGQLVSEAIAKHEPRIVVNVYVPKSGDEVKALDLLSKELFLLDKVQTI